jgi:hypothetical protein
MLEIGLWQSISSLISTEIFDDDASEVCDYLIATAKKELPGQTGWLYADATMRCLRTG